MRQQPTASLDASAPRSTVLRVVTAPGETSIERLEEQLEGVEKTLSALRPLGRGEADRIAIWVPSPCTKGSFARWPTR